MNTDKSLAELKSDLQQIKAAIEAQTADRVQQIMQELQELAEVSGKSVEALLGLREGAFPTLSRQYNRKAPIKVPVAKYANPADTSQTWSGMGRKPQWVHNYLVDGGSLEQIQIS